ncbi:MAG: polysaccharide deacetylase family protein [Acidimicrobiales bacterium]
MRRAVVLGAVGGIGVAAYAAPSIARAMPPRLLPRLCGIGDRGHVALTFDDGPDPASTPAILAMLDRLGWRATFFCLGSMAEAAPSLLEEMVAAGHEIGVHGYIHEGAIRRSPRALTDDVTRTRDVLRAATGVEPYWYRPPYGELSLGSFAAARRTRLRLVLWSAWGRDWRAEATPASVVADLARGVLDGGTMLLHDSDCTSTPSSWRMTVAALPLLADHLATRGLRVGTLAEHGLAA